MFQNILEDVIAMEEEASTNNDNVFFAKNILKINQKKIYIWHYGIMKKLKSQMNSIMKKKF